MEDIEKKLNIPLCEPQRVPIKMIVNQLQPTPIEKRLLETHIGSVTLVGLLNEQTIRIRHYKDDDYSFYVIYVLKVALRKHDSVTEVATMLHSAFPESTLLIINCGIDWYISAASKRINKVTNNKSVVEDVVGAKLTEESLPYLDLSRLKASNLKELNDQIVLNIYKLKVMKATGIYPKVQADYKKTMKKYDALNARINQLKESYKLATMLAEKMDIDNKIEDTQSEIKALLEPLKGE